MESPSFLSEYTRALVERWWVVSGSVVLTGLAGVLGATGSTVPAAVLLIVAIVSLILAQVLVSLEFWKSRNAALDQRDEALAKWDATLAQPHGSSILSGFNFVDNKVSNVGALIGFGQPNLPEMSPPNLFASSLSFLFSEGQGRVLAVVETERRTTAMQLVQEWDARLRAVIQDGRKEDAPTLLATLHLIPSQLIGRPELKALVLERTALLERLAVEEMNR